MSRFCPVLESLENRSCPAAPVVSLAVAAAGNSMVTLSGVVQDESPGNLVVNFSGVYNGWTETDANGAFSVTVTPNGTGTVSAYVYDNEGDYSQTSIEVQNDMPMILEFTATQFGDRRWRFSGRVADEAPAGLVIYFSGIPSLEGQTATVQSDGTFALEVELEAGEEGYLMVWTVDWWNQMAAANETVSYVE